MSAISATNNSTGISDLMWMLAQAATPAVSSLLSSSQMQSALAKAPPVDLVQLSDQAMQLQEADGLFGSPGGAQAANSGLSAQLQEMSSLFANPATTQPASYGLAMQNLLTSIYTPSNSGSTINLLA